MDDVADGDGADHQPAHDLGAVHLQLQHRAGYHELHGMGVWGLTNCRSVYAYSMGVMQYDYYTCEHVYVCMYGRPTIWEEWPHG